MKSAKVHIALVLAVLAAAVIIVSLSAQSLSASSGPGQASRAKTEPAVRPTSRTRTADRSNSTSRNTSAAFVAAATQNMQLRNELTWTFGGKQQRGWYLYDLLISKTLDTQDEPGTSDFAAALASWQKRNRLSADGLLDQDVFMRLVSHWQGNRLKQRNYPDASQLVTAPPADFYDPGRAAELRQVERNAYAAYKRMIAAAIADPELDLANTGPAELAPKEKYFKIISSFRSREYQDELRRRSPNAGSAGLAVNSPHFTGRALDIYVGGDPVDTKDSNRAIQVNTPAYRWLVRNAERFGFRPYFYEPWHWEYVG
ncbi:MAG TPA: D-alanyl-D-alanine carboxypeptidase family protein [Pyrinomonadaceae bacterium]|nr:D-alanyl-D-alanine carboxypeptidase family protein [Pyrinomonadaceae bacterium]